MSAPPIYYVLFHSPGPHWEQNTSFREQPGVERHVAYMAEQHQAGLLAFGGPFLDDSGGMMALRAGSIEEARAIAEADPTVRDGLLVVHVRPWMLAMQGGR